MRGSLEVAVRACFAEAACASGLKLDPRSAWYDCDEGPEESHQLAVCSRVAHERQKEESCADGRLALDTAGMPRGRQSFDVLTQES